MSILIFHENWRIFEKDFELNQKSFKSKVQVFALGMRYLIWEAFTGISEGWTSHICICYSGKCENLDFSTRLAHEQFVRIFKQIWLHYPVICDFHSKSSEIKSPGFGSRHAIFDLRSLYIHISNLNKPYLHLLRRKMRKPGLLYPIMNFHGFSRFQQKMKQFWGVRKLFQNLDFLY